MGSGGRGLTLPREFFARPALEVAPALLGCVLEHQTQDGLVVVRITEVEAYMGADDPASHAYRGRTARNAVMFGPPGHAYVYFTYGMHFCVNLVCLAPGTASAVLLRAGEVIAGEEIARARRQPASRAVTARVSARDLARGPGRLCQALGIDRALDGADVCDRSSSLRVAAAASGASGAARSGALRTGPRVGVREGADVPWRFWLDGEPTVSVYRPHVPRRGSGQAGSGQAGSGQAGSGQEGSGQAGSGQGGSGQAGKPAGAPRFDEGLPRP
jgi:DNA-3-methyladenine glycosylase